MADNIMTDNAKADNTKADNTKEDNTKADNTTTPTPEPKRIKIKHNTVQETLIIPLYT